ncbi:MAG: VacB/RNase II family 3'-5' exoribonuclease, partial [Acetobacterales bacterium]
MAKADRHKKAAPFPTREQVLRFIEESEGPVGKREIARAFSIHGDDRVVLKQLLKSLEKDGLLDRESKRRVARAGRLPAVAVVEVVGPDPDGELLVRAVNLDGEETQPTIYLIPERQHRNPGVPAYGPGDRLLCRLRETGPAEYEARPMRRLPKAPDTFLAVYRPSDGRREVGRLVPTDRRLRREFEVDLKDAGGAKFGDLVRAEALSGGPGRGHRGARRARVTERLGRSDQPGAISAIAIAEFDIPEHFPPAAVEQADRAKAAPLGDRTDIRDVPLVTIDGEDARDFDDAVWAEPDASGGWQAMVAIADVAWYVRPDDALDRAALERGNSVYFPDRVVPMLPEALSNGWCSLRPKEDRPCLVARMRIAADGKLKGHRFERALMRSAARLTYEQVQYALDGTPDDETGPLLEPVLKPLRAVNAALEHARAKRGALELDLPERQIILDQHGNVAAVTPRARLESHRLIENLMITANVAAAETLEKRGQPCMYRVHDQPDVEKLADLREFLKGIDLKLPAGRQVAPAHFNRVLSTVKGRPEEELVNQIILRSQSQAAYSPDNIGHFGLGLQRYAHFTSPIRRYSDLLVHRALIRGLGLGAGGLGAEEEARFGETATANSGTERRAAAAA